MNRGWLVATPLVALLVIAAAGTAEEGARLEDVRTGWQNTYGAIICTVLAIAKNASQQARSAGAVRRPSRNAAIR